jgi:orotate phosphoribosyltransferase
VSVHSDLDLAAELESCGARRQGHFQLSSGRHSADYIQCALLLEEPSRARRIGEALAATFADTSVDSVLAPALGGMIIGYEVATALSVPFRFTERKNLVMCMRRGFSLRQGETVLIIEDVVTTGRSTKETVAVVESVGASAIAIGSIIDRTVDGNVFAIPFRSLLRLVMESFDPETCPLCRVREPLASPGSRNA